ncbi:MAG: 30S ribosomal protein S19e [Euryarchaeota archaeon]|nr:30S ribosomal protein S19e [Euryarchaeota archaeon]
MTTVFDVPPEALIPRVAEKLKQVAEIQPPEWAAFVKTGPHREKPPERPDWWHLRMAAILRKVYMLGPVGTSRLSARFGGARDRRDSPNKAVKGSGSISRKGLQQLEKAGLIQNIKGKGRTVTAKGRQFLDNAAREVALEGPRAAPGAARH